jgi:hypothetical protein
MVPEITVPAGGERRGAPADRDVSAAMEAGCLISGEDGHGSGPGVRHGNVVVVVAAEIA